MGTRAVLPVIGAALLLGACAPEGVPGAPGGPGEQDPDAVTVDCGGSVYDAAAFADAPPATSLPEGPRGAVDDAGAPAVDPSQGWRVVHEDATRVDLVRELDVPVDVGGGDVRTHDSRTLERLVDVPDGTWLLTSAGPCVPRRVSDDGLGDADVTLAGTPSPDATTLDLLVRERACASGRSAEGRVEVVQLVETAEQVRVWLGVQVREGNHTCPGNPPTPFTVELADPLGDREVVDASVVPERPMAPEEAG